MTDVADAKLAFTAGPHFYHGSVSCKIGNSKLFLTRDESSDPARVSLTCCSGTFQPYSLYTRFPVLKTGLTRRIQVPFAIAAGSPPTRPDPPVVACARRKS